MLWLVIAAGLFPPPAPDTNEARIVLLRAELRDVEGAGLLRFDQAAMLFAHTAKSIPPWREPALGGCVAGEAPAQAVRGYLTGAAPLLTDQLPGDGLPLREAPRLASGGNARTVQPVPGAPGVYSSTIGGTRGSSARDLPLFFSGSPVALRVEGREFSLDAPRAFVWPQRDQPMRQRKSAPLRLRWEGAPEGEMWIALAASGADREAHWLICRQQAARASLAIPARLLSVLPATESATLLLVWVPRAAWRRLALPAFESVWAVALHAHGSRIELLR